MNEKRGQQKNTNCVCPETKFPELKSNHVAGHEPQSKSVLNPCFIQATERNYISGNDEDAMR
jgi:hypothetical protein